MDYTVDALTQPVEPVELELVSTMMLEQLIDSADDDHKQRMRKLAETGEGVLARDTSNNEFNIVRDDELEAALQAANREAAGEKAPAEFTLERVDESDSVEELSLVTTQVLRKMIGGEPEAGADDPDSPEDPGGYNPYDHT